MKSTSALITAPHFPVEWTDHPDADPPPGKYLAQALLDDLLGTGRAKARKSEIEDWAYEHSSWFFHFELQGTSYQVDLEGGPTDRTAGTWHICFTKFHTFFGGDRHFEVPDDCLELLYKSVCRTFGIGQFQWLTEDEAISALWG